MSESDYKNKRGKRDKMIGVWCSKDEYDWIEKESQKIGTDGISKGNYCRKVVLCKYPQARVAFSKTDRPVQTNDALTNRDLKQVLNNDLARIGNNINQLAKHVNEQREIGPRQNEELKQYRKDLDTLTGTILKALS